MLLIFLFILGCTPQVTEQFNVSLIDPFHEDVFVSEQNRTLEKISFTIQNNERFDLDCGVVLSLDNITNSTSTFKHVGIINPDSQKRVSLSFEMFYGNTSLQISPDCKLP